MSGEEPEVKDKKIQSSRAKAKESAGPSVFDKYEQRKEEFNE